MRAKPSLSLAALILLLPGAFVFLSSANEPLVYGLAPKPQVQKIHETQKSQKIDSESQTPPALPMHEAHEVQSDSQAKLRSDLQTWLYSLPLKSNITVSAHRVSESQMRAGETIGGWLEVAEAEPSMRGSIGVAFLDCADSARLALSIRAHCYSSAQELIVKYGTVLPLSRVRVAESVKNLAAERELTR